MTTARATPLFFSEHGPARATRGRFVAAAVLLLVWSVGVAGIASAAGEQSADSPPRPSPTRLIDRVVAEVDGEVVTARDLGFWVWQERLRRPDSDRIPDSALAPQVLRNLADEILMSHWAEENLKEVDDEEIESATNRSLEDLRRLAPTQSKFEEWLADSGFDLDTVRRYLRERERRIWLIRSALATRHNVRPSQMEGAERTEKQADERPVRVRLRQILLRCPIGSDDEETSRVLFRALAIRREILGGLSFSEAAELYSDDRATRDDGGEVGWIATKNLNPVLRKAVAGLNRGDVSEPVRTEAGWRLMQVVDLETPTGLELMDRVRTAYNETLDELRRERSVRVAEGYFIAPPPSDESAEGETPSPDPNLP